MLRTALWSLLQPVITVLVKQIADRVLKWAQEQATNGTLGVTNGVPESLVNELVDEL